MVKSMALNIHSLLKSAAYPHYSCEITPAKKEEESLPSSQAVSLEELKSSDAQTKGPSHHKASLTSASILKLLDKI